MSLVGFRVLGFAGALVEIFFAGLISRNLFKEGFASREGLGIMLIVVGVIILLNW